MIWPWSFLNASLNCCTAGILSVSLLPIEFRDQRFAVCLRAEETACWRVTTSFSKARASCSANAFFLPNFRSCILQDGGSNPKTVWSHWNKTDWCLQSRSTYLILWTLSFSHWGMSTFIMPFMTIIVFKNTVEGFNWKPRSRLSQQHISTFS